jgi:hypothetical protein
MAGTYLLSKEDRSKLQKLIKEHDMSRVNHRGQDSTPISPEVYIAKVQDDPGSIPALKPAGADDYDHPGCAVCDIYQIMPSDSSENWDLMPISNFSQPVYNLSSSGIGKDWLLVIRDKAGRWIACVGGGGIKHCNATLSAALNSNDDTGTVDGLEMLDGSNFDESHPDYSSGADELTVWNGDFQWKGDDNAPCKIELNMSRDSINGESGDGKGRWELYQLKCPV